MDGAAELLAARVDGSTPGQNGHEETSVGGLEGIRRDGRHEPARTGVKLCSKGGSPGRRRSGGRLEGTEHHPGTPGAHNGESRAGPGGITDLENRRLAADGGQWEIQKQLGQGPNSRPQPAGGQQ